MPAPPISNAPPSGSADDDDDRGLSESLLEHLGIPPADRRTSAQPTFFKSQPTEVMAPRAPDPPAQAPAAQAPAVQAPAAHALVSELPVAELSLDTVDDVPSYSGRETTYDEFCDMLKLPAIGMPHILPVPTLSEADRLHAVNGAMLMREANRAKAAAAAGPITPPKASPVRTAAGVAAAAAAGSDLADIDVEEEDLLGEGLDESTLAPGGTRDVTKSPQHHKLQMDNFLPEDDLDDCSEEEGEWVDVGNESTGGSPQTEQPPDEPRSPAAALPPPRIAAAAASDTQPARVVLAPIDVAPTAGGDTVAPFALDPNFDYDAPIENTPRFSVARALVEGEYYDQLMQQVTSPSRIQRSEAEEEALPSLS